MPINNFTRSDRAIHVLALLAVACLLLCSVVFITPHGASGPQSAPDRKVTVVEVTPLQGLPVTAEKSHIVEFRYRLTNRQSSALTGLKLGISCRCKQGVALPDLLPAGASAECSILAQATTAGAKFERVSIQATGFESPVGYLTTGIRVESHPPELVHELQPINWTRIENDKAPNRIVLQAVEVKEQPV